MKRPKIEDYSGEDVSGYAAYNRKTGEYYEIALEQYCDELEKENEELRGIIKAVEEVAKYPIDVTDENGYGGEYLYCDDIIEALKQKS